MAYSSIAKPSDYFNTVLYTGNGSTNAITGVGFQPDWTWTKRRDSTGNHSLYDAVRGVTKRIESDTTDVEQTVATSLTAFNTDGFTLGSGGDSNGNSETYASWNWRAGNSAGSSNSDGSVTSTVSANTTAGFSICKFTYPSSGNFTFGHGLGVAPTFFILKGFSNSSALANWQVYSGALGNTQNTQLNSNSASNSAANWWNSTSPTSTVCTVGSDLVEISQDGIAYVFAEKQGYSKFGTYTGNGNADGSFIYTGFKPAWVMIKNTAASEHWRIYDNKRDTFNHMYHVLFPNQNSAESTVDNASEEIDFLSNGVKIRSSAQQLNGSGQKLIYMAFAENPFVTAGTKAAGTAR